MKQCSRPQPARTTSQQRSTLPATGRGTIFLQGSRPWSTKCSPAGGYQPPSLPYGDSLTLIRSLPGAVGAGADPSTSGIAVTRRDNKNRPDRKKTRHLTTGNQPRLPPESLRSGAGGRPFS